MLSYILDKVYTYEYSIYYSIYNRSEYFVGVLIVNNNK